MFGFFKAILGICETKPLTSGWEVRNGGLVVNSEGLAGIDSLGGAAYLHPWYVRASHLAADWPNSNYSNLGFRCADSP